MLSTLNNLQDLDPEYLEVTFPVQRTVAHKRAGRPQCGMTDVLVLRSVEIEVIARKTANVWQQSLFDYVITVIFCFLVKINFIKFSNCIRNHKAMEKELTSLFS